MPIAQDINLETDGRAQRTLRSRLKIIEATFDLYVEGILVPTAQEVADRSGLGIRTVFRHFSEMESLFIAGDALLYKRYAQEPEEVPEGDLDNRIEQLVSVRMRIFHNYSPHLRATMVQKWRYAQLDKQYRSLSNKLRKQIRYFLPETEKLNSSTVELLNIALSFECWDRLRTVDRRSKKAIKEIVLESVTLLMKL